MRSEIITRLSLLALAGFALTACSAIQRQAGLTKQPPDEFAVVTKAPLIIPPDFNLRPPAPGAPPLNQQDPNTAAEQALFNSADPATAAAGMTGNFTPGEKMLLATAHAQSADPAIRTELQSDTTATTGADQAFVDRVLNGPSATNNAASKANPASIKKDTGGWFDWF